MNPFEPLPLDAPTHGPPPDGAPEDWTVWQVVGRAWRLFTEHPLWWSLQGLVVMGVTMAPITASVVLAAGGDYSPQHMEAVQSSPFVVASGWLLQFVMPLVTGGTVAVWLAAVRGEPFEGEQLLAGVRRYVPLLLAHLIIGGAGILLQLIGLGVNALELDALRGVVGVVSAIVGYALVLVFLIGLQFTSYFVVDAGLGPVEAIAAAWTSSRGDRWKLLGLGFVLFLGLMVGMCACGLGLLAYAPLLGLANTTLYVRSLRPRWEAARRGAGAAVVGGAAPPRD